MVSLLTMFNRHNNLCRLADYFGIAVVCTVSLMRASLPLSQAQVTRTRAVDYTSSFKGKEICLNCPLSHNDTEVT